MGLFGGSKHKAPICDDFKNIIDGYSKEIYRCYYSNKRLELRIWTCNVVRRLMRSANRYKISVEWEHNGLNLSDSIELSEKSLNSRIAVATSKEGWFGIEPNEFDEMNIGCRSRIIYVADKSLLSMVIKWGQKKDFQINDYTE